MISRTTVVAILASSLALAAGAAPQNQLVVPNLNPGLKTVPFIPASHSPARKTACDEQADSSAVVARADGQPAPVTGATPGVTGEKSKPAIMPAAPDGRTATEERCPDRSLPSEVKPQN